MKTFAPNQLDFYKVGHIHQYPEGTEYVYSNFTPRSGKLSGNPDGTGVYTVGLQLFLREFLVDCWNDTFFNQPKEMVCYKFWKRVSVGLGQPVTIDHLESLHDLGYLPLRIKGLPEGSFVPYKVPLMTITNTLPDYYWLPNALESVLSASLWQMINSATTYKRFRELFETYSDRTCDTDDHVDFQGHDFSYRGMAGPEAAARSGFASIAMGSKGTDIVSALDIAEDYYYSGSEFVAGSVNATEHSVMCAGGQGTERDTYLRLLTDIHPTGILSIVSDTWDFWKVVTETLPSIKTTIMARDGKLVIRPDSGDPVDIICGRPLWSDESRGSPETKGLIQCLWNTFGGTVNSKGHMVLDEKIGAIYGDSITFDRAETILRRLEEAGFASSNITFGIGAFAYQYNTRDTHGLAMKATNVTINGVSTPIFKDPKTDDGTKKSAKGLLMVTWENGSYNLRDNCTPKEEARGCLKDVFIDGQLLNEVRLDEVRNNSFKRT